MLGRTDLGQTKKVAQSRSQDQYHERRDMQVTGLVFSGVMAARAA